MTIQYEKLDLTERIILLKAFDYDVDEEGFIIDLTGSRIPSDEGPYKYLKFEDAMIALSYHPCLKISDGTSISISELLSTCAEVKGKEQEGVEERA